jgi:hypothetical protein
LADAHAAYAIANDEAADHDARRSLKMMFDEGIDPAYDLTLENSGEGNTVSRARPLLDTLAKIVGRIGVAELAAKLSGCLRIVHREPADRKQ